MRLPGISCGYINNRSPRNCTPHQLHTIPWGRITKANGETSADPRQMHHEILAARVAVAQSIPEYLTLKQQMTRLDRAGQLAMVDTMIAARRRLERA